VSEAVLYYWEQLRKGNFEDAYHSLIELDDSYLPELIDCFYQEKNAHIQAILLEAIWQHRSATTLGYLKSLLTNANPDIWKLALDGIIAINNSQGLKILEDEKVRLQTLDSKTVSERLEWVEESYNQLQDNLEYGLG
jgi:hypothetical protein